MEYTFGEQTRILMMRRRMSMEDLAAALSELREEEVKTADLELKFENDNFHELEMREIALVLGYRMSIELTEEGRERYAQPAAPKKDYSSILKKPETASDGKNMSLSDDDYDSLYVEEKLTVDTPESRLRPQLKMDEDTVGGPARKTRPQRPASRTHQMFMNFTPSAKIETEEPKEDEPAGEINPLTGMEYLNNTVRRIEGSHGLIEVYDAAEHTWVETAEDEFRAFQARKQEVLGADYEPPLWI